MTMMTDDGTDRQMAYLTWVVVSSKACSQFITSTINKIEYDRFVLIQFVHSSLQ